jgi:tRNA(fMet)-specific endonuclease VapC
LKPRYLLDTNTLSEPFKRAPHRGLLSRLQEQQSLVATAAPVWHELIYGWQRMAPSQRRRNLEEYLFSALAQLAVLPYDAAAAAHHATERARLTAAGRTPAFVDGQIAAVAHVHGLVVVTHNVADFAAFSGIEIEDWTT